MSYWLNVREGEWGLDGAEEVTEIRIAMERPDARETEKWVNRFVDLMEREAATHYVEDRAEFEFLFRCLETIGCPLAYSPFPMEGMEEAPQPEERFVYAA